MREWGSEGVREWGSEGVRELVGLGAFEDTLEEISKLNRLTL